MHVNSCKRLFAASSLAFMLTVQPCQASIAGKNNSRSFQTQAPAAERFSEPQSTVEKILKSSLQIDMVRGQGIEDALQNKDKKFLMDIINYVFENDFFKGVERRHVAKRIDTLAKAGHMFSNDQKRQIVLGMAVTVANEMRVVSKTREGAEYIKIVFSTLAKTTPENRIRLEEVKIWVFCEENPEALADRLVSTAAKK